MIGDPGGHGWSPLQTRHAGRRGGEAQTGMVRTEVVDASDEYSMLQRQRTTRQRPPTTCQRRQALPERGIEPLDVVPCCITPFPCERRLSVSTRAGVPSMMRRSTSTMCRCA